MSQGQFLSNCAADTLSNAAESLKSGALVAFPTETVYGLGADASNEKAVARIYEVRTSTRPPTDSAYCIDE
jgi:L-threonylcarbamoyladenylate synthase